tara:strand:- start:85 stop:1191 length:1107 start_codon:yes stop_codon:yes gene_type:complete
MQRMKNVKIYGAGSIGNHLANAARTLGWSVDIFDIDSEALIRTKEEIYPSRYGLWDNEIGLYLLDDNVAKEYDYVFVGTPPDKHVEVAINSIRIDKPQLILVEKPFCTPDLTDAQKLYSYAKQEGVRVFVGYDHVVGESASVFSKYLSKDDLGGLITLDVEFREHWGGIFEAHPWLNGPQDTYLGFWEKGGGSTGEHSHALNLWQHLAYIGGQGKASRVSADLQYIQNEDVDYDQISLANITTDTGFMGRVVQDVVTQPTRKWARAQAEKGFIEWQCNFENGKDRVIYASNVDKNNYKEEVFEKTRPDDFIRELRHIDRCLEKNLDSPISIEKGLETMLLILAIYTSSQKGRSVKIRYDKGFTNDAII